MAAEEAQASLLIGNSSISSRSLIFTRERINSRRWNLANYLTAFPTAFLSLKRRPRRIRVIQTGWIFKSLSSPSECSKARAVSNSLSRRSMERLSTAEFSWLNQISPCSSGSSSNGLLNACSRLELPSLLAPHMLQ